MSNWQLTCECGKEAKDAVGNIFKPGDTVAYIRRGDIYKGIVKKINLREDGDIRTCWITPEEKWHRSGHSIVRLSPRYENGKYVSSWNRRVISRYPTPFVDDTLIPIYKIIKIN